MLAWLLFEHARARIDELRAEADRRRLVGGSGSEFRWIRRRLAAALLALGSSFTVAGRRVIDDAALVR